MKNPQFKFSTSKEAAFHNWNILQKFELDLEKAILAYSPSQLSYGSEFKDVETLSLIFKNHPLWNKLSNHLRNGCSYPMKTLDKERCRKDLIEAYEFGNHKGVENNKKLFQSMMDKEVQYGWAVTIPRKNILDLKGETILSPMKITDQMTIDETGKQIKNQRLTHNWSME